jgi:3-hydroxybutyryl-CoA dehydratase
MPELLYFEDLRLGDRWVSPSRVVTEQDVVGFAQLTGDLDPLHTDEDFARRSPFGRPIAHGVLGLSFATGLASQSPRVETVAFLALHNWRFVKPVYFGDRIHVVTEIVDTQANGRKRGRVIWKRSLVNQRGEIVQEGLWETLVARRTAMPRAAVVDAEPRIPEVAQLLTRHL